MEHVSVLLREAVDALDVRQGGRYVDGTLGRAGHTREILRRGGEVLGIDRDDEAIAEVSAMGLKGLKIAKGEHGDLERIAHENGWDEADGVLLDLGVSSPQLDDAGRGFSFLREGPLDMRMDRAHGLSAADVVNGWGEQELAEVIWRLGEERGARRVAAAIVKARAGRRIETTAELAEIVERAIGRHGGHHPATRTFQALRMAVNDELGELERALDGALRLVKRGGRIAVITFESLTDTVVKRRFAAHAGREVSLQGGGSRWEGERPRVRIVSRKAVKASENEILNNPRSRSAKLRVIEKEEI
ncbi:MAG: 16S rRNA (cytosine(1402)-N(4))-methyltransferase RsmH [Kiritimatiellae bacterium]|nr:16S rRNA (cytosine(1402)-N(4))-methyltransferase RsmH [Kiritimatiellia bacterium]